MGADVRMEVIDTHGDLRYVSTPSLPSQYASFAIITIASFPYHDTTMLTLHKGNTLEGHWRCYGYRLYWIASRPKLFQRRP
jgi:hypothetical protein